MDYILFLSVLGWCGFVFFLVKVLFVSYAYYHYNTRFGKLELALQGVRIKSYGFQKNLLGFVVCVGLLVSLG